MSGYKSFKKKETLTKNKKQKKKKAKKRRKRKKIEEYIKWKRISIKRIKAASDFNIFTKILKYEAHSIDFLVFISFLAITQVIRAY